MDGHHSKQLAMDSRHQNSQENTFHEDAQKHLPSQEACQRHQQAEVLRRNESRSPLYKMPCELLYEIHDNLALPDAIIFEIACSKTRSYLRGLLLGWIPLRYSQPVKLQLQKRFRRDQLRKLCRKERTLMLPLAELVCSRCVDMLPMQFFSPGQMQHNPEKRLCRGHEGVFRLCTHVSLDYESITRLRSDPKGRQYIVEHSSYSIGSCD